METSALDAMLLDALEEAWDTARSDRRMELLRRRMSRWTDSGLHRFSSVWGRVTAWERLTGVMVPCLPQEFREAAEQDADEAFLLEARLEPAA